MTLKVAVQMDHISTITIAGDTTFALCLEAQSRGYSLFHYTPERLSMLHGKVFAHIEEMHVQENQGNYFTLSEPIYTDLSEMDIILLRQDPPFDMHYITTTYFLERLHPKTLVINNPTSVRNCPEKIFVTLFPELMPETLITRDEQDIISFRKHFDDIIIKPLYANGGAGVFHIKKTDLNLPSLLETFKKIFREPFIVQRYLGEVRNGDKRIMLIDGKPAGALNRIPAHNDVRSNLRSGGRAEKTTLTKRDLEICDQIGPYLRERGFLIVGIDVIGGYITEINVTSPTGIREVKRLGGADIAPLFWDTVEEKLNTKECLP